MKRSIARKWAKALESGEYGQTTGTLRDENGFCCLGVLCNLHAQEHPEIAAEEGDIFTYLGEEGTLPKDVKDWVGMGTDSGAIKVGVIDKDGYKHYSLMDLNDNAGMTFPEIAKVIRKHWKEL